MEEERRKVQQPSKQKYAKKIKRHSPSYEKSRKRKFIISLVVETLDSIPRNFHILRLF